MNIKELIELYNHKFDNGLGCPTVKFDKKIEDWDTYFDAGMVADVHSIKHMADGETVVVTFNIESYHNYNVNYEKANYYDLHGEACLTATEAGMCPQRKVTVYFYLHDGSDICEIVDEVPTRVLLSAKQKDFLIHAAKMEAGVYRMRAKEASKGNLADDKAVQSALKYLKLAETTIAILEKS
jgi:hypothetical protein